MAQEVSRTLVPNLHLLPSVKKSIPINSNLLTTSNQTATNKTLPITGATLNVMSTDSSASSTSTTINLPTTQQSQQTLTQSSTTQPQQTSTPPSTVQPQMSIPLLAPVTVQEPTSTGRQTLPECPSVLSLLNSPTYRKTQVEVPMVSKSAALKDKLKQLENEVPSLKDNETMKEIYRMVDELSVSTVAVQPSPKKRTTRTNVPPVHGALSFNLNTSTALPLDVLHGYTSRQPTVKPTPEQAYDVVSHINESLLTTDKKVKERYKAADLKQIAESLGLPKSGTVAELVERIRTQIAYIKQTVNRS